jgi:hypothetical protein
VVFGEEVTFKLCGHRTSPTTGVVTVERTGASGSFSFSYTFLNSYPAGAFGLEIFQQATSFNTPTSVARVRSHFEDLCLNVYSIRSCDCCDPMPDVESVSMFYDALTQPAFGPPYVNGWVYTITLAAPAADDVFGYITLPPNFSSTPRDLRLPYVIKAGETSYKGEIEENSPQVFGDNYEVQVSRYCGGAASTVTVIAPGAALDICKTGPENLPSGSFEFAVTPGDNQFGVPVNPPDPIIIDPEQCLSSYFGAPIPFNHFVPGLGVNTTIAEAIVNLPGPEDVVAYAITVTPPSGANIISGPTGLGTHNASIEIEPTGGPVKVEFNNAILVTGDLLGQPATFNGDAFFTCNSTACATFAGKRFVAVPFIVPAYTPTSTVILSLCPSDYGSAPPFITNLFLYEDCPFNPAVACPPGLPNPCDAGGSGFMQSCHLSSGACSTVPRIQRAGVNPGNYVAVVSDLNPGQLGSVPFTLSIIVLPE